MNALATCPAGHLTHATTVRGAAPAGSDETGHAAPAGDAKETAAPATPAWLATKLTFPEPANVQPAAARLVAEPASEKGGVAQVPEPAYMPAPHGTGAAAPPTHACPAGHGMTRAGSPTQYVPTGHTTPAAATWSMSPTAFLELKFEHVCQAGTLSNPGSHA